MKHNITTKEISLTPAIKDHLEKRIAHLDRFIGSDVKDEVMCYAEVGKSTKHHKNGDFFVAELTVHIGGKSLRAEVEKDDLYAAIDEVIDEMSTELKRFSKKKTSVLKRTGAKVKAFIKGFYEKTDL